VVSQRHLRPEKGAGKVSTPPTGVAETFDHQTAVRSNPSGGGRSNSSATCRDSSSETFTKTAVAGGGFGVAPPGTAMGDSSPEPQPEPALPPPSLPRAPRLPTEPAAGGYDHRPPRATKAPSRSRQTPWVTAGGDEPRPPDVWQGELADAIKYTLEKDKERREKGQTSYSTYIPARPAPAPTAPPSRPAAPCRDLETVDTDALKRQALAALAAAAGPTTAKPAKRPSRARQKAH